MQRINVEIKAQHAYLREIHDLLVAQQAEFIGTDYQTDTYYQVPNGRLKLRQGNIENALIHYFRNDQAGPKRSDVSLYKTGAAQELNELLGSALPVLAVVAKRRAIYFLENVKFHIDEVDGLGDFVEIEAIDRDGSLGEAKLREQCEYYLKLFRIKPEELIEVSYSDLMIKKGGEQ